MSSIRSVEQDPMDGFGLLFFRRIPYTCRCCGERLHCFDGKPSWYYGCPECDQMREWPSVTA